MGQAWSPRKRGVAAQATQRAEPLCLSAPYLRFPSPACIHIHACAPGRTAWFAATSALLLCCALIAVSTLDGSSETVRASLEEESPGVVDPNAPAEEITSVYTRVCQQRVCTLVLARSGHRSA